MVVISFLALTGSGLFLWHRSDQGAADQARADVDRSQALATAAVDDLARARAEFDEARQAFEAEVAGAGPAGVPGMGSTARKLGALRDSAQANSDRVAQIANQRNSQLNTVINARISAEERLRVWPTMWGVYGILATALLLMFGIWWLYTRSESVRESEDGMALDRVRQAVANSKDGDAGTLSWSNQTMLQEYHGIVLRSARSARGLTIAVLVLGFLLITVLGIAAVFLVNGIPATVAASVVTVAGAAVTGYITRAVLRNAENSAREVGRFFDHPRQLERVLAAERVLADISPEKSDEARLEVVRALVAPASDIGRD
ncbi:hypothetical protein [Actinokineospora globicatena]|uniref:hypothetical protein n=1 Tax=Actinokineospora globicatena TaxID=103729 RepID=UPI00255663E9|nr:hypothetical protein [Actinokineospora globicatena]